jgi:hypothetical protein
LALTLEKLFLEKKNTESNIMFGKYSCSNMLVTVFRKCHHALAMAEMQMKQWE